MQLSREALSQFMRYTIVGAFNFLVNAALFNLFLFSSGITEGPSVTLFAIVTFAIVATQSFFLNMYWTFHDAPQQERTRQYMRFIAITGTTALVNVSIIHFLVTIVGAPANISPTLWANIALLCTIVISVLGNFVGYKLFVFSNS
ncbi:GtrA family protein [Candidatus Kaiserbacteria bacterium]|nr:GtrA family protein [Candidatus Kaiserbacteria bacterium]